MAVKVKKTSKKSEKKPAKTKGEVVEPQAANPLVALRGEIDQLFENMMSGWPNVRFSRPHFDMDFWREPFLRDPFRRLEGSLQSLSKLSPRADMTETDGTITISAELPGVAEQDIDISIAGGRVTISAEKKEEARKDDADYHLTERHYGSVKRTFSLPETVDADKAKAAFKDGLLTIEVPKKALPKSEAKKIPIKG